ncbi:hypothetical protein KP79_PYT17275 [Mizuhopecten yessoensis]|uniref:Uncharacterized protein n=1 Tax=Mizuhopecten yessoensis TaxID=6573 RepID=A0A210PPH5_MIZYE|nr:hypothetical protein KP79_PYT17275 [Mizuhopecten yessoensis]
MVTAIATIMIGEVAGGEAEVQGSILDLDPEAHIILVGIDLDQGVLTTMTAEEGHGAGVEEAETGSLTVAPEVGQGHMTERGAFHQKGQDPTVGHSHREVATEMDLHARVAV